MKRTDSVPKLIEIHGESCSGRNCVCEKVEMLDVSKVLDWDQKPKQDGETKRQICLLLPADRPWFDMDDGGGNHYHGSGDTPCSGKLVWQTNLSAFAA